MKRMIAVFAGAVVATATLATAASAGTAAPAAASCTIHWGSLPKSGGPLHAAPLIAARTSQHRCYDQVVFEFNGRADGYRVRYGDPVTQAGFAMAPYMAGGALLTVVLLDPANNIQTGAITYAHRSGDHVANVLRDRTLRDVMYGGSFEGYTTFGVGVRARLPFRVFVLSGPGTHTRIVLDIAHRWMH